jgi:MFS family permease
MPSSSTSPWKTPLVIIACGCLMSVLSFGPRQVLGLFLLPISTEHGWSRDVLSMSFALQNLMWGIGQPFVGAIADRFGTLKVFWVGAIMYGLGFVVMALPLSPIAMHVLSGTLIGFGLAGVSFNLVLAAFAKMLPENQRSSAYGIGTAASSFGQFLYAPLTAGLIGAFGWKTVLIMFGASAIALIPLAIPLSTPPAAPAAPGTVTPSLKTTLSRAFSHPSYVFLVLGFFTCGFQLAFITSHMPAYLLDVGIAPWVGGWAMALIGMFNMAGSLTSGWLAQRMSKPVLLFLIYAGRAIAVLGFVVVPPTAASALIFAASMGFLWLSTVPPTSALVAQMFGVRNMAMLYGFAFFSHQVGGFLGVYLGGYVYEKTGSYMPVWWLGVFFAVGSALINLPIKEKSVEDAVPQPA